MGMDESAVRASDQQVVLAGAGNGEDQVARRDRIGRGDQIASPGKRQRGLDRGIAQTVTLRRQRGYDHSYYFISTFMADHVRWHAARLTG